VGATDKKNSQHEKDGELFYDYEVTGAVRSSLKAHGACNEAAPIICAGIICTEIQGCSITVLLPCRTCTIWHQLR